MAYDLGVWELLKDLPPPDPISGSGTSIPTSCVGATPAQLSLARDQIIATVVNAKDQVLAALPDVSALATKADLSAATTQILAAIAIISATPPATSGFATVDGTQFAKLQDAANAVTSGGTVLIHGEMKDQNASAAFPVSCNIVGTASGKLTWTLGTSVNMAFGKGLIVCSGLNQTYLVDGLELNGARVSSANGAGVRGDGAAQITVQNCNIHDNEDGVLSVANVQFYYGNTFKNNGNASGGGHNLYVNSTTVAEVTAEGNTFYTALVGNQFKSRAKKTTFRHNTVAELDGACSWQIDIPNGGDVLIEKNVVEQGPNAQNRNMISYGPEGLTADGRVNSLSVLDNIIVNDHAQVAWGINIWPAAIPESLDVSGNTWVGPFAAYVVNGTMDGTNVTYPDRVSAGLGVYPVIPGVPA